MFIPSPGPWECRQFAPWISIPAQIPFTLQTFGVFMAVGVLGGKRGTLAVLVYVLLGAVGVPVFAGFSGGIGSLLGNAGGYIIGFIFSALVMWAIESVFGRKPVVQIISMIIGLIVCYAFGTAWFMFAYTRSTGPVGLMAVLGWCVFPFIIIKIDNRFLLILCQFHLLFSPFRLPPVLLYLYAVPSTKPASAL